VSLSWSNVPCRGACARHGREPKRVARAAMQISRSEPAALGLTRDNREGRDRDVGMPAGRRWLRYKGGAWRLSTTSRMGAANGRVRDLDVPRPLLPWTFGHIRARSVRSGSIVALLRP
jgi:hypothetical protein